MKANTPIEAPKPEVDLSVYLLEVHGKIVEILGLEDSHFEPAPTEDDTWVRYQAQMTLGSKHYSVIKVFPKPEGPEDTDVELAGIVFETPGDLLVHIYGDSILVHSAPDSTSLIHVHITDLDVARTIVNDELEKFKAILYAQY